MLHYKCNVKVHYINVKRYKILKNKIVIDNKDIDLSEVKEIYVDNIQKWKNIF